MSFAITASYPVNLRVLELSVCYSNLLNPVSGDHLSAHSRTNRSMPRSVCFTDERQFKETLLRQHLGLA